MALLFSVDPESGELTSKFNFAYDMENPAWRHVTDLKPLDTDEGKVLKITFELTDYDQTARIRWDEASGKFIDYKIKPGELLESIMKEFLSRNYYSEPTFEGNEIKGKMRVNIVENVREFKTWYEDARYNFDDHAKGVAGCEIGDAILLEKYKSFFGIEGDVIIDKEGHNVYPYISDSFTGNIEKKVINWWGEWKTRFGEKAGIGSALSDAIEEFVKEGRPGPRVVDAKSKEFEFPNYGYAFAMKITESYIEIRWEKVEIPKS